MRNMSQRTLPLFILLLSALAWATPELQIPFKGDLSDSSVSLTGNVYMKFSLYESSGNTTVWSNDGTGVGSAPAEPTDGVTVSLNDGLFTVWLGDTSVTNMTVLSKTTFDSGNLYLRIWISEDNATFTALSPDKRMSAEPFAFRAHSAETADDATTLAGVTPGSTGLALLNDASTTEAVATLGLGTASANASGDFASSSHGHAHTEITGLGDLATQSSSGLNVTGGSISGVSISSSTLEVSGSTNLGGLLFPNTSGNSGQLLSLGSDGALHWMDPEVTSSTNAYLFSVGLGGVNQSLPSASEDMIDFNTVIHDTTGGALISGGNVFQPTIAGYYLITAFVSLSAHADGTTFQMSLYKNGVRHVMGSKDSQGAMVASVSVISHIVEANGTTDYFDLRAFHNDGSTKNLLGDADLTRFSGVLLSGVGSSGGEAIDGLSASMGTLSATGNLTVSSDLAVAGSANLGGLVFPSSLGNSGQVLSLGTDGTLDWADVTSTSGGNAVSFMVRRSAIEIDVPDSVDYPLDFDNVIFDHSEGALSAGGNRFQPTVPGVYMITASATLRQVATANAVAILLYKNGSVIHRGTRYSNGSTGTVTVTLTTIIDDPAQGDYYEVYINQPDTDAGAERLSADLEHNSFAGVLLSGGTSVSSNSSTGAYFKGSRSATQSILTNTGTNIQFDNIEVDSASGWDGTETYVIPEDGDYLVNVYIHLTDNTSGTRQLSVIINGVFNNLEYLAAPAENLLNLNGTRIFRGLSAGDRLNIRVAQTSGVTLNIGFGADNSAYNYVEIVQLGGGGSSGGSVENLSSSSGNLTATANLVVAGDTLRLLDGSQPSSNQLGELSTFNGNLHFFNGQQWVNLSRLSNSLSKVAFIKDVKAETTPGGEAIADTVHVRDLNTLEGDYSGWLTLSANQFTLQAGEYVIEAQTPGFRVGNHQALLHDGTAYVAEGAVGYSDPTGNGMSRSFLSKYLSLGSAKTFELRHYVTSGQLGNGLGTPAGNGTSNPNATEVHSVVRVTKLDTSLPDGTNPIVSGNLVVGGSANLGGIMLPNTTGSANQVLSTDGTGQLVWQDLPTSKDYMAVSFNANQTANIAVNDRVRYDNVFFSQGEIELVADGQFSLKANRTYQLTAKVSVVGAGGYINGIWYDVTNGAYLTEAVQSAPIADNSSLGLSSQSTALSTVTPSTDIVVELRLFAVNGVTSITGGVSFAVIESIGAYVPEMTSDINATGNLVVAGSSNLGGLLFPVADGTSGQALMTDGAGSLTFGTVGGPLVTVSESAGNTNLSGNLVLTGSANLGGLVLPSSSGNSGQLLSVGADGTLDWVDASVASGANGYAFHVYLGGVGETWTTNTPAKVPFNTATIDTTGGALVSGNSRFQPTVAGTYFLTAQTLVASLGAGKHSQAQLYKNGNIILKGSKSLNGVLGNQVSTLSQVVTANGTTDYFEIYFNHNHGSDRTLAGGLEQTSFSGFLLSATGESSASGNAVSFKLRRPLGSGINVPDSVETLVDYTEIEFDNTDGALVSGNNRFQPTVPGVYMLTATASLSGMADATIAQLMLKENGTNIERGYRTLSGGLGVTTASISTLIETQADGDYYEIHIIQSDSDGGNEGYTNGDQYHSFSGVLISASTTTSVSGNIDGLLGTTEQVNVSGNLIVSGETLRLLEGTQPSSNQLGELSTFDGNLHFYNGDQWVNLSGLASSQSRVGIIKETKPSDTNAGSASADTVHIRQLNELEGDHSGWLTLSGNQFSLVAGRYLIEATAPAFSVGRHQAFLHDGISYVVSGTSEYTSGSAQNRSKIHFFVDLSSSKTYELRHWTASAFVDSGLGLRGDIGVGNPQDKEIYSVIKVTKLDSSLPEGENPIVSGNLIVGGSANLGGLVFPITSGSANQVLVSDGNGLLSWQNQSSTSGSNSTRQVQELSHTSSSTTMLSTSGDLRFNISNISSVGANILHVIDDGGKTIFQAQKPLVAHFHFNAGIASSGQAVDLKKNGTIIFSSDIPSTNGYGATGSVSVYLNAGDNIHFFSGGLDSDQFRLWVIADGLGGGSSGVEGLTGSNEQVDVSGNLLVSGSANFVSTMGINSPIENSERVAIGGALKLDSNDARLILARENGTNYIDFNEDYPFVIRSANIHDESNHANGLTLDAGGNLTIAGSANIVGDLLGGEDLDVSGNVIASVLRLSQGSQPSSNQLGELSTFAGNLHFYNGNEWVNLSGGALGKFRVAHLKDVKASSTPGGGSLADTVHTRDLNTIEGDYSGWLSLSSNQFTLTPGEYVIEASVPGYKVGFHQVFLHDGTSYVAEGTSSYGDSTTSQSESILSKRLSLVSSKTFELRHWTQNAVPGNGLGVAVDQGAGNPQAGEIYSVVKILKMDTELPNDVNPIVSGNLVVGGSSNLSGNVFVDGYLGVGVASPESEIHVGSADAAWSGTSAITIQTGDPRSSTSLIHQIESNSGVGDGGFHIAISDNTSTPTLIDTKMTISEDGGVGIGIGASVPGEKLEVAGNLLIKHSGTTRAILDNTSRRWNLEVDLSDKLHLADLTASIQKLTFEPSSAGNAFFTNIKNFGLGTASPDTDFHFVGSGSSPTDNLGNGIHMGVGAGNDYFIELVANGETPYIDFTNDNTSQMDARIILNSDEELAVEGANLMVTGSVNVQGETELNDFVAARYKSSSGQSVASNAVIKYESQDFDTHSAYNTSTGVYTVPRSGYYQVNARYAESTSAGTGMAIQVNGTSVSIVQNETSAALESISLSDILKLDAGDTLTVIYTRGGSATLQASGSRNTFSIMRMR